MTEKPKIDDPQRLTCDNRNCGWSGHRKDAAFFTDTDGDYLPVCPNCQHVESSLRLECALEGCKDEATCGWTSIDGYLNTCGDCMRKHEDLRP